ncbi:hypothetical protein [Streptococcus ruminantium]|uniref:Bacteriocin immunity protein n=1 Tax=Streptococcus ruminantium TaxID=1917441 RepID=A0ABU1B2I1_9STRE|nr:hypothetical protein [Streptococcus ruminantium]MDQ8759573.1 hypothetical protein [Streptococcus ruminantium]MDQ8765883.1 hypothetical protein [Streptococcus ruminantium]MDQ8768600.1 hypothetical protein [Streptococcus ruminantium]MDQ8775025.1 hypothetical protein [Streptococcus ruminantium]MDQ8793961.1 hypothetical protein [Streptococcus ruminantium]
MKEVFKFMPEVLALSLSFLYISLRMLYDLDAIDLPAWFEQVNVPDFAMFTIIISQIIRLKGE